MPPLVISHPATVRLAEIGLLLFAIAGVWLVASELQQRWARFRTVVSGLLITTGAILLIIAVHSGSTL